MAIIKHICKKNYVVISNSFAQNKNLSYEARGVLLELLSRPEDWVVHKNQLCNKYCKITKLNRIFTELKNAGYLKLIHKRSNNKISGNEWIVTDDVDDQHKTTLNDSKTVDYLNDRKPDHQETCTSGNQHLQSKDLIQRKDLIQSKYKKKNIIKEKKISKEEIKKRFESFYQVYPLRKNKKKAYEVFEKLNPSEKLLEEILNAIKIQITEKKQLEDINLDGGHFFIPEWPYPSSWLNQERWNDDLRLQH